MKIAIQGCGHGEMEKIYDTIQHIEEEQGFKVPFYKKKSKGAFHFEEPGKNLVIRSQISIHV